MSIFSRITDVFKNKKMVNYKEKIQNNKKSPMIELPLEDIDKHLLHNSIKLPTGRTFYNLHFGPRNESMIGMNKETGEFLKIELVSNTRKMNDLFNEAKILKILNKKECISCPKLLETGTIIYDDIATFGFDICDELPVKEEYPYIVQEFIHTSSYIHPADLILALIEQKNLGIYQGDLKPANIRYDRKKGICVLVDYDQAEILDDNTIQLDTLNFLYWCNNTEMRKYGENSWLRHFNGITYENDILPLLKNGALNLAETSIYRHQLTTNTPDGIYHTINERDVYSKGIRDLENRRNILDSIKFNQGERILDIGCNAGLLCNYLYDRGCDVTGAELDESMVLAAGIIARITHRNIKYIKFDLDNNEIPMKYDTITLFSVIHHTRNIESNALKIADSCNRIIIECRLKEEGSTPIDGKWHKTSNWLFQDIDELIQWLEKKFSGFSIIKNYGIGDRNRYILEFVKN